MCFEGVEYFVFVVCGVCRYCSGGLPLSVAESAKEQYVKPDILQRGQLYQVAASVLRPSACRQEPTGRLVSPEGHQHTSHVTGRS